MVSRGRIIGPLRIAVTSFTLRSSDVLRGLNLASQSTEATKKTNGKVDKVRSLLWKMSFGFKCTCESKRIGTQTELVLKNITKLVIVALTDSGTPSIQDKQRYYCFVKYIYKYISETSTQESSLVPRFQECLRSELESHFS